MSLAKKQFDDLYFGRTENENEIKYTRVVKKDIIFDKETQSITIIFSTNMFDEVEKMKLQQEAMEALEWIEYILENIKGDTFFEANKNDCLSAIAKAIKKLV